MDRSQNTHPCPGQGLGVLSRKPVSLDPSPKEMDVLGEDLGEAMDDVEVFSADELTGVSSKGQYPQGRRGRVDRDVTQTDSRGCAATASVKEQMNFISAIDKIPYQVGKVPFRTVEGRAYLFDGEGDLHL